MNPRNLLITLSLIVLALLIWQLRWVLLVLFGAVVLAVALDVPVRHLIVRWRIPRPLALLIVLLAVLMAGLVIVQVLLPQLFTQFEQLTTLLLRRTVNLLPTIALTSQLSLGALLGLPGVLLALPLVVVLQVGIEQVVVRDVMDHWT